MRFICEKHTLNSFQCLLLRSTGVHGYTQIDTTILCQQILLLGMIPIKGKMVAWKQVVDLGSKPLKAQLTTDGVRVTVLKQDHDRVKGGAGQRRKKEVKVDEIYIHNAQREELEAAERPLRLYRPRSPRSLLPCMKVVRPKYPCSTGILENRKGWRQDGIASNI